VRSGDVRRYATAAALLLLAGGLAGCVETTQQKNARADLQAERLLASRSSAHVTRQDPNIAVLKVRILRNRGGVAVAVTLRNDSSSPVSDLPISVGIKTAAGRTSYLNRRPELPYFQTHIAGVAGKAQATWVFSRSRPAPNGRPFARVGSPAIVTGTDVTHLPPIASSVTSVSPRGHGRAVASAQIANRSDISQAEVEVYAYAISGDRLVAAGTAVVESLGSGAKRAVQIPLLGNPGSGVVQLQTPPTNLR
jgi:hypothetical protein